MPHLTCIPLRLAALAAATLLAACSSTPPAALPPAQPTRQAPIELTPLVVPAPEASLPTLPQPAVQVSEATNPRAYRRDAAARIYEQNQHRIWKGRMKPLLYAIGVLRVEIDEGGNVIHLDWMRAPNHAPEVVAEIERTVRSAAPYPAPARMGRVTYTDTWLWDKSGRFQLDTLTEGQD